MTRDLESRLEKLGAAIEFSGSFLMKQEDAVFAEKSLGYENRSNKLPNTNDTRYGIASGSKLFTGIAICQLVEKGDLTFETKLKDCLDIAFPNFDESITIHHLLTHTSGAPDYFDEEVMDDYEALWEKHPMYLIKNLTDFLPLFQYEEMKLKVGERFHYNNAGYILLGLIVEQISGLSFTDYVEINIFQKAGMNHSGYFSFDRLPEQTALGYVDLGDGEWKTNLYSLPIKGGADGGAFITTRDMAKFWDGLLTYKLLSKTYTEKLLTPYVIEEEEGSYYGYGVWLEKKEDMIWKYHVMGYDPGVSFHSAYYPEEKVTAVVCSNESAGAYNIMEVIEEEVLSKVDR